MLWSPHHIPLMLVHCVARAPTPLGTFPQRCAWTHSTLTPFKGCFRTSMLQGCYRCCPCSPFLGWFLLLLCPPAGECLLPPSPPAVPRNVPPFATDAPGQGTGSQRASLHVQWHLSGHWIHTELCTPRLPSRPGKVLLLLCLVPPALPLLERGTQEIETAHSREEALQMQWRPAHFPVTTAFQIQRGSSPASQRQHSC